MVAFIWGVGVHGEGYEWALYLCLGLLVPLVTLGLFSVEHWTWGRIVRRWYRPILGVVAVLGAGLLCLKYSSREILVWAATLALLGTMAHLFSRRSQEGVRERAQEMVAAFTVAIISWLGALHCLHWTTPTQWLLTSRHGLTVFLFSIFMVGWVLFRGKGALPRRLLENRTVSRIAGVCGHGLALSVFGLLSFRTDSLPMMSAVHHWSFWVGPIESVREGGWLLWDVPSQYGFLSIILLAVLPIRSAWESLFVLQAVLLWIVATWLYFCLRRNSRGILNYAFSFFVAVAAVYFMGGLPAGLQGPHVFPSVGPMRFFWCYVLLFVLWICLDHEPPRLRLFRWLGGVAWVAGVLWSMESAVYTTGIYGGSCAVIALQAAVTGWRAGSYRNLSHSIRSAARAVCSYCLPPFGLLFAVLGAIRAFYLLRLGHAPDWSAFWEYASLYSGGFGALPIEVNGPVWILVVLFCAIAAIALALLGTGPLNPSLGLIAGVYGAVWTTASYYVSRSHPNNVCNLMPILVMALALLLAVARRLKEGPWPSLLKQVAMPVFVVAIVATGGNPHFSSYFPGSRQSWNCVTDRLPLVESSLRRLVEQHNVNVADPMVCNYGRQALPVAWTAATDKEPAMVNSRSWLPKPIVMLSVLPQERRAVYIQRYCERARQSGWFLMAKGKRVDRWLMGQIKRTHKVTTVGETSEYGLYWCEYNEVSGGPSP
jgi:hypothetical protein